MVEHLHRILVRGGRRQQLHGLDKGLARPRGRPEPALRVRLQEAGDDVPERRGNAFRGAGGPMGEEMLHQALGIGLAPPEEVQGDQADGEEVGGEVGLGAQQLFGGEIARSADHVIGLGQPGLALAHGDAEVGQPQVRPPGSGGLHQDVGRFDVTVDHALRMHRGQPRQELVEQRAHETGRQGSVVPDHVGEGAAADQVHGEQDLVVVGRPAGRGQHVRVIDPQRLLPHEPQERVGIALQQDFRGDVPAAAVIPGPPHGTRTTAPDRIDQLVPTGEDLTHRCARPPSPVVRPRTCQFWWAS